MDTARDRFEVGLVELFGERIIPVERAAEIIKRFKDGSFAFSEMGMMLYTNGYNLRGQSTRFPNGLVYFNGVTIFGVGYFAKEGESVGHLMIVSSRGGDVVTAVCGFIARVRAAGLTTSSVYVRHLSTDLRDQFFAAGAEPITADPWHTVAIKEDETFPNRVFFLEELIELHEEGYTVKKFSSLEDASNKKKNRFGHQRFKNFLQKKNKLQIHIEPYGYVSEEVVEAQSVVQKYFDARCKGESVVGSTPEDYFAIVRQKPSGKNEQDYFAYRGWIEESDGTRHPILFFAGERVGEDRVALYCTITLRFREYAEQMGWDTVGFTAIPQYVWLDVFARLLRSGIKIVDAGGSETLGLDDQKRQLGGKAEESHWVVFRGQ